MNGFRFSHPELLYLLLLIPLLVLVFLIFSRMQRNNRRKFGDIRLVSQLMPELSVGRPVLKFVILMHVLAFAVIGISGPQFGSKLEEVKREGVEIVIALDVSNSMLAEDIKPNRLERAKRAIAKLIDRLHNDKIGIIVFAGQAYSQLPITNDYAAAKMFLSAISTESVPIQGTAIGAAIELGMNSFSPENDKNRAIIVITDGENHEDDALQQAMEAEKKGVIVHTIGMGLPKGGPIPIQLKYGVRDYRKDKNGSVIITKLNEGMLQQVAGAGGGVYIRANNTSTGLNKLFDELNAMDREEYETMEYTDYDEYFMFFIFPAILFALAEILIMSRKNRMFMNVNLFKNKEV